MLRLFLTALTYYSRLPCPKNINLSPDDLTRATALLPLIGWIIGGISGLVFLVFIPFVSTFSAALLATITGILLTGALHEDGFADACDGFGGGWEPEQILSIMKDSRIGVFGALGLSLLFLTKISLMVDSFQHIKTAIIVFLIFVNAHTLSRFMATCSVYFGRYARAVNDKKAKASALHQPMERNSLLIALGFTLLPFISLILLIQNVLIAASPIILMIITWRAHTYFNRKIGGYTGDCLGAIQQLTEATFYLCIALTVS